MDAKSVCKKDELEFKDLCDADVLMGVAEWGDLYIALGAEVIYLSQDDVADLLPDLQHFVEHGSLLGDEEV